MRPTTKMATTIPTNGEDAHERPRRHPAPSAALLAGQATIPSQLKAVEEFRALEPAKRAAAIALAIEEAGASTPTPPSSRATSPVGSGSNTPVPSISRSGKKRAYVEDIRIRGSSMIKPMKREIYKSTNKVNKRTSRGARLKLQ